MYIVHLVLSGIVKLVFLVFKFLMATATVLFTISVMSVLVTLVISTMVLQQIQIVNHVVMTNHVLHVLLILPHLL